MIRTLIVDDEFQGRNFLEKVISKLFPDIKVVGQAANLQEAVDVITQHNPDLVFLDVMLNNENGFDLFEKLNEIDFETVFTTAYNEFAIKAFKFNALDYLLKPIDIDELEKAINKAKKKIQSHAVVQPELIKNFIEAFKQPEKTLNKLSIPTTDGFVLVPLNDIIYCGAFGNYTNFFLASNKKLLQAIL